FFALFGFIFLITQYFQLVRGYSPLQAGVRTIPVAISIALASVVSPRLVERIGTKKVVSAGLASMAVGFLWVSTASGVTPYGEIVGSVSTDNAGVGSAVNDTTRELGGTLGVAVIGSVFTSVYVHALQGGAI